MQFRQVLLFVAGLAYAYSMPPPSQQMKVEATTYRPVKSHLTYPAALMGASAQGLVGSTTRSKISQNKRKEMPTPRPMTKMYSSKPSNTVPITYSSSQGLFTPFIQPANLHSSEEVSNQVEEEVQQGKEVGEYYHGLDDHDAKYEFVYRVQDHEYKPVLDSHGHEILGTGVPSDYGHSEARSGEKTWGRYFVKLPDGRVQTVRYWADHTGYHAEVLFTGEAQHPKSHQYSSLPSGLTTHSISHDGYEVPTKQNKAQLRPTYVTIGNKHKYQHDGPSSEDQEEHDEQSHEQTQQVNTHVSPDDEQQS